MDLTPFFGDLGQSEKVSEIEPPLPFTWAFYGHAFGLALSLKTFSYWVWQSIHSSASVEDV